MARPLTLLVFAITALVTVLPARGAPPNIVVIYADDHAQQAIGAYGSRINRTPHLDELAAAGMIFRNSFVGNSICGPSRATFLTGLHAHAHGQTGNRAKFRDELPTFARLLQAEGYATAVVGKWHLSSRPDGFDYWALKKGHTFNPSFDTPGGTEKSVGHVTDVITDRALAWIGERGAAPERPFMIWISHTAAHRTWIPPLRHLDRYDGREVPEPATLFDDYTGKNPGAATAQMRVSRDLFPAYDLKLPVTGNGILDRAAEGQLASMTPAQRQAWDAAFGPRNEAFARLELAGDDLTRWNYQRYIKNYLRSVDGLDDGVGKVRSFLETHGLADRTIVIYTSDQGFFLGEHGWYDKRWMYEEAFRTPLIVHWPGVTSPGSDSDALVQNIDLAPTLLQMAGLDAPDSMHGRSLAPLLAGGPDQGWRDAVYYHYRMEEPPGRTSHLVAKHYGIRTARHKLIHFYEHGTWELYDLDRDPNEIENLYGRPDRQALVSRLEARLRALRATYGDATGSTF